MKFELLGKKLGMSQVYDENNNLVPVTIIEAGPCPVLQVKTDTKDGYSAVQIGFNPNGKTPNKINACKRGHARKPVWTLNKFLKSLDWIPVMI